MTFDTNNPVVQLCIRGMDLEGRDQQEAKRLFLQAWQIATTDFERFTAAHYVARQQPSVAGKLEWDQKALHFALSLSDQIPTIALPSLYLNIGKGYEELGDREEAVIQYQRALSYVGQLPDNGYGNMIRQGIEYGLQRTKTEPPHSIYQD